MADDIVGNTRDDTQKPAKVHEKSVKIVRLKVNGRKTKIVELLDTDANITDPEEWTYKKISEFQYLGVCLNTKHN